MREVNLKKIYKQEYNWLRLYMYTDCQTESTFLSHLYLLFIIVYIQTLDEYTKS